MLKSNRTWIVVGAVVALLLVVVFGVPPSMPRVDLDRAVFMVCDLVKEPRRRR